MFLFDTHYANYGYSDRKRISDKLFNQLIVSFSKSQLLGYISFRKVGAVPANISMSGVLKDSGSLRNLYLKANTIKTRKPTLPLHKFQKAYKADLVISITKINNTCGTGTFLPNKDTFSSRSKSFEFADGGQVFINNSKYCFDKKSLIAHEVGHTFGLWHGKAVKDKTHNSGDYNPLKAFASYANGFGNTDYYRNYGTIMAASYLTNKQQGRNNRFSNPYSYTCGYYYNHDEKCGDSTANAVKFLKANAYYYNKRGDWYK